VTVLAFLLLICAILSLWIDRQPKIWGTLLAISCLFGMAAGLLSVLGIAWILLLVFFWYSYSEKPTWVWFVLISLLSISLRIHLLPGFQPASITPKFSLGLEGSISGILALALTVPLVANLKECQRALRGILLGCAGIAVMALLAIASHTVSFDCKLPSFMALRTLSNLFFTSIPEEGLYRGFFQSSLCRYFGNSRTGKGWALLLTALVFTAAHIFWSPNLAVLIFVFVAGLLYGGVYLWSGRIESAIFTHFLLNLIHMSCFSYHAM